MGRGEQHGPHIGGGERPQVDAALIDGDRDRLDPRPRGQGVLVAVAGILERDPAHAPSRSDLIALAPERLLRSNAARLRIMPPPLPVEGFTIVMLGHDRVHRHPANAWLRERIAEFART
jgi:hypothetical protein